MAAQEQQRERVVGLGRCLVGLGEGRDDECLRREQGRSGRLAPVTGDIAPQLVREAARGDRHEPAARVVGNAVRGPLDRGGQERLLDRVLGGVECAVAPDQRTEDLRRELAQQALDIVVANDGAVVGHIS